MREYKLKFGMDHMDHGRPVGSTEHCLLSVLA